MHGRFALALVLLLACRPDGKPVAPAAPATGGDFVAASSDAPAPDRSWRDALRADRQAIRIPDHTPVRGAKEPLVTIVQFGDYTDPASATQARAIADALERWPNEVSTAFVQLPSRSRRVARMAAETAASAGGTDQFWQLHDRLFASPPKTVEDLERIATGAGLDAATWKQSIDGGLHRPWIEANAASARELGIVRAPALFVNGRPTTGEAAEIVAAIEAERGAMAKLVDSGLPRAEIYAEILAVADVPRPLANATADADATTNFAVPAAERPVLGPVDALVTIVAFSDFQCPYCAKAQTTLAELRARHPDDVRIVFRNLPLAFHRNARDLAKLALAADAQGKFWPVHDMIFARRDLHTASSPKPFVKKLRLDAKKLGKALKSPELERKIAEDEAIAKSFGVNGTPTFFVNGRRLGGAQPIDAFEAIVMEELAKARDFVAHDPGGEGTVYDRMIEGFVPGAGP